MAFLRVVEFFQPLFALEEERIRLRKGISDLVSGVREAKDYCDVALVGEHKSTSFLKFSSIQAAAAIQGETGVETAPTIVVRDSNRVEVLSKIVTSYGLGLRNLLVAWGDEYPHGGPRNSYDFPSLAAVIYEARRIAALAGVSARIFAPVHLESLSSVAGAKTARSRVRAGARFLLAQPPTTGSGLELARHSELLEATGLKGRVLLNAFPLQGKTDVERVEGFFGWKLPKRLHGLDRSGADSVRENRRVVAALRARGFPGVYVSTRGDHRNAGRILSQA